MLFNQAVFIGIDPNASGKEITFAVLDHNLQLVTIARENLSEVLAYVNGQRAAFVAVNAPSRPNQDLMKDEEYRADLDPQPSPGRWTKFRVAEYQLFQKNIRIPLTRSKAPDCPNWMQTGFKVYRQLKELGYQHYPAGDKAQQMLEVYPHASYTVLLGSIPFKKDTLEGRLQRQLVLHSRALDLPDPMRVFEEITRYRILQGVLPLDRLYDPEELDALVAAYTAWLASAKPSRELTLVGDPEEGQIVLPSGDIKRKYS